MLGASSLSLSHGSLFSGIGGPDLAADWMGWKNVFHCEINPFGQQVLKYYYPDAISYADITKTDFSIHRGTIDVLTGGFPCQPYSVAGKRLGKEDDRHLWPEMLRAIGEIQPSWVVGENVRGLTNWNGGLVFDEVQADLEAKGYEVIPFLLPACAVNAPHRRDRIWFVAYSDKCSKRPSGKGGKSEINGSKNNDEPSGWGKQAKQYFGCSDVLREIADTECIRQSGQRRTQKQVCSKKDREWKASWSYDDGRWPTQSPVCSGNDGISTGLSGITVSKHRNESIKAYGNAIVPQVIYQIFKSIGEYEGL